MKNQKRIAIVMAVAFIFSSLAGCSKVSSKEELPETTMLTEESVIANVDTTEIDESEATEETTIDETTTETTVEETNAQETTESSVNPTETTVTPTASPTTAPTSGVPSTETSYVCPTCGDSFGELALYNSHIQTAHATPTPVPTSTPRPTTAPTATPTPAYTQTRVRETWRSTGRWSNNDIALAATYGITLPTPPTITYVVYQYPDGRRETDLSGSGYSSWEAFENAVFGTTVIINGEEYWCTNYGTYSDGYNGGSGLISSRTEALINGSWQPI